MNEEKKYRKELRRVTGLPSTDIVIRKAGHILSNNCDIVNGMKDVPTINDLFDFVKDVETMPETTNHMIYCTMIDYYNYFYTYSKSNINIDHLPKFDQLTVMFSYLLLIRDRVMNGQLTVLRILDWDFIVDTEKYNYSLCMFD